MKPKMLIEGHSQQYISEGDILAVTGLTCITWTDVFINFCLEKIHYISLCVVFSYSMTITEVDVKLLEVFLKPVF